MYNRIAKVAVAIVYVMLIRKSPKISYLADPVDRKALIVDTGCQQCDSPLISSKLGTLHAV